MPASIGINLRVTGHCRQGGRKYMEDCFSVAYQQTDDERDLEYAFFGIYDGHGGAEAAAFAKEHLMDIIVRHKSFWSDNDEDVLKAIKDGYIATHYAMWKEQGKWPKTASGLPSTAGTTASVAFIRRGKIYIGHVGDSGIILGYQEPNSSDWKAKPLTNDHKPESVMEMARIEQCGGKVVAKSGVPRVVWNRPRIGHRGPVRRSTPIDEIPFLAVARSLGDLWSYNSQLDEFVVSPEPDCIVIPINTNSFRCLIFGTDGLYNMLSPQMAVYIVQHAEKHNEDAALSDAPQKIWLNPSKCLVEQALERWSTTKMRADNTTVVTVMLDPPGPPRAQVLKNRKKNYSDGGLQIVTRYENESVSDSDSLQAEEPPLDVQPIEIVKTNTHEPIPSCSDSNVLNFSKSNNVNSQDDKSEISCSSQTSTINVPETFDKNFIPRPRESLGFDPSSTSNVVSASCSDVVTTVTESNVVNSKLTTSEENIQINEISSSSMEIDYHSEKLNVDYSKIRLTKRKCIGRTKRILNVNENLRRLKVHITQTTVESVKEETTVINSKVLMNSNATSSVSSVLNINDTKKKLNDKNTNCQPMTLERESVDECKVVTRSKTNNSRNFKDETSKENDTPKRESKRTKDKKKKNESLTANLPRKETRLTRKRASEIIDALPTKRQKVQVITKEEPVVVRKTTRQSTLNLLKPSKVDDETNKNVQHNNNKINKNINNNNNSSKLLKQINNDNNGEKNNKQKNNSSQRTPSKKSGNMLNLQVICTRLSSSSVEKRLPKNSETKKLDNSNKKNVMKEHKLLYTSNIRTRSNVKNDHTHHLRRNRK